MAWRNSYFSLLPALLGFFFYMSNEEVPKLEENQVASFVENSVESETPPVRTYQLFDYNTEFQNRGDFVSKADYMDIKPQNLKSLFRDKPQSLVLNIPMAEENIQLELNTNEIFTDDFVLRIMTEKGLETVPYTSKGLYYKGKVAGLKGSLVTVSVFEDHMMGIISMNGSNYNLGPLKEQNKNTSNYILYSEKDIISPIPFECHTNETHSVTGSYPTTDFQSIGKVKDFNRRTNVVRAYYECDYQMYLDNGRSEQAVTDYVTSFFNEVSLLYGNEQVLMRISEIMVWTTSDPYPTSSSNPALDAFTSSRAGNFNGDLGHLLSTVNNGNGGLAWVDVLCVSNRNTAYSNISNNFSTYPTFSWTVEVVTHETGHNIGSPHTQRCYWGPNGNEALDNCYPTEGGCPRGPAPTNGGTIMSYCHLASYGINFAEGFGQEPGNLIRNKVASASCLDEISDCFSKIPLVAGVTYSGNTANGGARNFDDYNCSPNVSHRGNEKAHSFVATAPGWVYINYSENMPERLDLILSSECHPDSCISIWSGGPNVRDSFLAVFNEEYVFIVDVVEDHPGGAYELTLSFPGSGCATTVSMKDGVKHTGTTADGVKNFTTYNCGGPNMEGKEVGHYFIAPESTTASIEFHETSGDDMRVYMSSACSQDSCLQMWSGPDITEQVQLQGGVAYYFIVDVEQDSDGGNYELTITLPNTNSCICTNPNSSICENFDSFTTGNVSPQSLCWENAGNPAKDGVITTEMSTSGDRSMLINSAGQDPADYKDAVINLGSRSSGKYFMYFKMNVEYTKNAYFKLYHKYDENNPANNEVAFDAQMTYINLGSFDGLSGKLYAGSTTGSVASFFPLSGFWNDFIVEMDLDNNTASLLVQGLPIHTWTFTNTRNGTGGMNQIQAVSFYADNADTKYFVEDFRFFQSYGDFCETSAGVFCESFDTLASGSVAQQSAQWLTMYGGFGGGQDAGIVVTNSVSGTQSVNISAGVPGSEWDNVVGLTGAYNSGNYKLQFKMFVPGSNTGYYRLLHNFIPDNDLTNEEFASYVRFRQLGDGYLFAGGATYNFDYPKDDWFNVIQLIDFDNDLTTLFVDGRFVATWPFSDTYNGTGGLNQLHGINLFADQDDVVNPSNKPGHNTFFYVDNVELIDLGIYLNVNPTVLNVDETAGSISFDVISNTFWDVQEDDNWVSASPVSGSNDGTIALNYDANTSVDTRKSIITVQGTGAAPEIVELYQSGADAFLSVDPSTLQSIASPAGTLNFNVTSNVAWGVLSTNDSWLTPDLPAGGNLNGSFSVSYTQNLGPIRKDTIIVTAFPAPDVMIIVEQESSGPSIALSTDTIRIPAIGASTTFDVISNVNWTIDDDVDWLSYSAMSGSDSETITLDYDTNPTQLERTGTITVTGDNGVGSRIIYVIQEANVPNLSASSDTLFISSAGGTYDFNLTGNVNWTISPDCNWATISPLSGTGNQLITVSAPENMTIIPNICLLTVSGDDGVGDFTVVIYQNAADPLLEATPLAFSLPAIGGDTSFSINSTVNWNIMENLGWVNITSATNGTGDAVINFNYTTNTSTSTPRTGTIQIAGTNGVSVVTINLNQMNSVASLEVDPMAITVNSDAGTSMVNITANVGWTASDDANWLTVSPTNGNGNGTLTLSYGQNSNTTARVANITVSGTGGAGDKIIVFTQNGVGVSWEIDPPSVTVDQNMGSGTITVSANAFWSASDDAGWLTFNPSSGFGNGSISYNYTANPSSQTRVAHITLTTTGQPDLIFTLTQTGGSGTLTVTPSTLDVPANSGSVGFDIMGNVDWTVSTNVSWLSVDPTSGSGISSVNIMYDANPTTSSRVGIVTVSSSNPSVSDQEIVVTQQAGQAVVSASPADVNVSSPAGTVNVDVISNVDWEVDINDSWISSVTPSSGNGNQAIAISYDENMGASARTGSIIIRGVGIPTFQNVTITQGAGGAVLSVDRNAIMVGAPAGSDNFNITGNVDWTASSNESWLTVTNTSGSGSAMVDFTYTENTDINPRSANITVSGTGVNDQIVVVTQSAAGTFLTLSTNTISVNAPVGTTNFNITTNVDWTAASSESWLTVNPTSGSGDASVTLSYTENTDLQPRTATVTITGMNVGTQTIQVTQEGAGALLTLSTNAMSFTAPMGSNTFSITSNLDWTVSDDASWLSVNPSSGNGGGVVQVSVDENTATSSRSAIITVSSNGFTSDRIINVTQDAAAAFLSTSTTTLAGDSPAGTTDFSVNSNVDWTVSTDETWLSVSPSSGTGNLSLTVSYDENPDTDARTANITVSSTGLPDQVIVFTQQGTVAAVLSVTPTSRTVSNLPGTEIFTISSNVAWSTDVDVPWVNLTPDSGTGNGVFIASYSANSLTTSRTALITISGAGVPDVTVELIQSAFSATLTMSPTNHDVGPNAGSVDFDITANVSWSINDDVDWLSVTPNFGTNGATVTAAYDENPTSAARVANITITSGGVAPITVTVTQSEATSTNDIDNKYQLKLYPNPTSDYLNLLLSMTESAELNLEILNVTGKKLDVISSDYLGSGEHLFKYDVQSLANGLYLVRLQSNEGVKTLRFVVNR